MFVSINEDFVFRNEAFISSIHSKKGKSYQGRALVLIASVSKIESYQKRKELFHHRGHREHRGYNYLWIRSLKTLRSLCPLWWKDS